MNNNELSLSRLEQAEMLHQDILTSYTLVQKNLWDMCMNLKKMRDEKLYKELGFSEFNDFTQKELGMSDRNVYNYISIAENVSPDLVKSISLIGVTKVSLLASLSEEKQAEVAEAVDLESVSVRELKEEINRIKGEKMKLENEREKLESKLADQGQKINALTEGLGKAQKRASQANAENARLERENKELRERPVEVAVVDNSDNERRLQETIRSLERENIRQNELMDKRYIEDRRKLEADKQREIDAIRAEYEEKLRKAQAEGGKDKDKQEFKIYLVMAHDALTRLAAIAGVHTEPIYAEKVKDLLNKAGKMLEG